MQRTYRRPHGWSGPGSAEEVEWLDGAEPPVQVVVVQLRALRPGGPAPCSPKPPRCSPGAANRTYKLPIEERVNEIMEATKKEYPNIDNYLLWLCAVDYV